MTDDVSPQAEGEVDDLTPESDATDEAEVQLDETGEPIVEDDDDDIEFEGKTFRGPKALKDILAERETVAASKAELEAARKAFEARQKEETESARQRIEKQRRFFDDLAGIKSIDAEILRWKQFQPRTRDEADERRDALDELREQREQAGQALGAKWREAEADEARTSQQAAEKERSEFIAEISKIPGFDKRGDKVFAHAESLGWTKEELGQIRDPRAVKALDRLYQLEQQLKSAARTRQVADLPTPGTPVKPKAAAAPLSDKSSIDAWMKARNAQIKRRA